MTTQALYLHCPSYQLSRWPRQDSPSGSRDGRWEAVSLGSLPLFGSCIHNSPCRYKSHCRRPVFACSPFHRSLSTEKRGVERGCSRDFLQQSQKASILHTKFALLGKLQNALSYLSAHLRPQQAPQDTPQTRASLGGHFKTLLSLKLPEKVEDTHLPSNFSFVDL